MIRQVAFWPVFVVLAILFVCGLAAERLFYQQVWTHEGLVRLAWFCGGCGLWFTALRRLRPRWLVRGTLAAAFAGSVILVGPQAALAAIFLFASAWALGSLVALEGVVAVLAGLGAYSFLIGFAVHLPVNYPAVYAAAFAIPILWQRERLLSGAMQWLQKAEDTAEKGAWTTVLLGVILLMHLAVALGPEVSADGLAMHLTIPASVHAHHRFTFEARETTWAASPMAGDWGFTAAYLLGGEAAARLFNFGLLLALAAMVYALARRLVNERLAILVTALFASSPMVQLVTGSLFVENFWAAMLLGAILALVRYAECGESRLVLAGAVLLGTGLATKFGSVAYIAPALLLFGVELRARRVLRLLPVAVALVLLFGSPPYVGALVKTGNPVYPFLNHIFKSPYFESDAPFEDPRFPRPAAATALYDLTFRTARHFEGQNGGWTFFCFLFVPLAVLLVRPRRADPGWISLAVAVPASVLTLASQGNVRYLYPALPFCAVAAAAVLTARYRATLAAAVAIVPLNVYFMAASGGYHKQFVVVGKEELDGYLAAHAPTRKLVAWLNAAYPAEPVVFVENNQIAGLAGRALTTTWHNAAFRKRIAGLRSPKECVEMIEQLGIRVIVAPAGLDDIPYAAVRRMVSDFTQIEFSFAGWCVRTLQKEPRTALVSPAVLSSGTYDDLDPRIEFLGRWESGKFSEAANGSITYSNGPGDWCRVSFQGTGITWAYTKAVNRGLAEVRVDGIAMGVVDLYSRETSWQARSRFAGLRAGPHVLEVRVLGTKNAAATDSFIDLDELVIE